MSTTTTTLPSKPSKLIRLALADLRECERDDGYVVDMCRWHWPTTDHRGRKVCRVGLVGAVLAQTLGVEPHEGICDADLARYGSSVQGALLALECFRLGSIGSGLRWMNFDLSDIDKNWAGYAWGAEYDKKAIRDPFDFYFRMNSLADYFESHGL